MALETEIRAYENRREELERHHKGKFIVFHRDQLAVAFDSFDAAAAEAVRRYGHGPDLIRQVGVSRPSISASLAARLGIV
jgi:hypothetical protein